jgi:hypothetical protein
MKARTITNNEFQVARMLPDEVGRILSQYPVYIRPFTYMVQRRCCGIDTDSSLLFCSPQRPDKLWKTAAISGALQRVTKSTAGQAFGARMYRHVSIAVTEKHVQQIKNPFNRLRRSSSECRHQLGVRLAEWASTDAESPHVRAGWSLP